MGIYMNRFGFGRPTSPDFPSESPGIVWSPEKLNDRALASISMGYQVAVTPLQMAAAMSAVANGGTWIEPRVVRAVVKDGVRTPITPKVDASSRKQRNRGGAAADPRVCRGGGHRKKAQISGFTVAGKTGTADKIVNGRYSGSQQNVSFVGFVPSRIAGAHRDRDGRYAACRIGHGWCRCRAHFPAHRGSQPSVSRRCTDDRPAAAGDGCAATTSQPVIPRQPSRQGPRDHHHQLHGSAVRRCYQICAA